MNIKKITENGTDIAVVESSEAIIKDAQSALDLLMNVYYI